MEQYDLIVLGGGPAGYNAAERAAHGGLKTLLIEKNALGGVCLNEGCIPSKTLLNSAKMYDHARHSEQYGVTAENVVLDHAKVVARKKKVVKTLVTGVAGKMKRAGVKVLSCGGESLRENRIRYRSESRRGNVSCEKPADCDRFYCGGSADSRSAGRTCSGLCRNQS